jgi:hypothetical protein
MTTLLILTGPQGAGNHLFAKLFSQHPAVNGWTALRDTYWVGHDQEPFAELWRDPNLVNNHNWTSHEYHVTSISCPYRDNGQDAWPNYEHFIEQVQAQGINTIVAVIGRDQNVLSYQETRLRKRVTYTDFTSQLPKLIKYNPIFLSQELAYLYKEQYLCQVAKQIDFPFEYRADILIEDANAKYLQPVKQNWLDPLIIKASNKS